MLRRTPLNLVADVYGVTFRPGVALNLSDLTAIAAARLGVDCWVWKRLALSYGSRAALPAR